MGDEHGIGDHPRIEECRQRDRRHPHQDTLQRFVVGDGRFVYIGLREEGGFIGPRDRRTRDPLPEHISARAEDLRDLIEGILAYEKRASRGGIDPVIAAAVVAFGFLYVHPFEDGNGRIHRWLIHHVLAKADYNPPAFQVWEFSKQAKQPARYTDRLPLVLEGRPLGEIQAFRHLPARGLDAAPSR